MKVFRLTIKCVFWFLLKVFCHRKKSSKPLPENHVHCLINISSGIGDAVMALPMIHLLKRTYSSWKITLLLNRSMKPVYALFPWVDKIYCIDDYRTLKSLIRFIIQIRQERFSVYIGTIPSNTLRMLLIPFLAGISLRVKHRTPHRGCDDFDFLYDHIEPLSMEKHRVESNIDLLRYFQIEPTEPVFYPELPLKETVQLEIKQILEEHGYETEKPMIAVHPGCSARAIHKRWPVERFAELLNRLGEWYQCQILVIGGPDEINEIQMIEKSVKHKLINLAGQINLLQTAGALSFCRFLICNDSGIMHLAAAVDIPVIAIFGPTNEKHIGPYGSKHVVIRNGTNICDVTVDQVYKIIIEKREDFYKLN